MSTLPMISLWWWEPLPILVRFVEKELIFIYVYIYIPFNFLAYHSKRWNGWWRFGWWHAGGSFATGNQNKVCTLIFENQN